MKTQEILKNKIEASNKLKKWVNKSAPKLIELLHDGYKLTDDFCLYKKDKMKFDEIIKTAPFKGRISFNKYRISLITDITYKTSEFGCAYYSVNVDLMQNFQDEGFVVSFTPLQMLTEKKIKTATKKINEIKEKIRQLKSTKVKVLNGVDGFLIS